MEIRSPALADPHGVGFIDADALVVANRAGLVPDLLAAAPRGGHAQR